LHSFFEEYEKVEPVIWQRFSNGKDKKVWFENEVLKMVKDAWSNPLLYEFEKLILKLEQTAG